MNEHAATWDWRGDTYRSALNIPEAIMVVIDTWARARSKDPRTKVGAAIHHPRSGGIFLGYNGFPVGMPDLTELWDRRQGPGPTKYDFVIHAEINAINKAQQALGDRTVECHLYCTHRPCHRCLIASHQAGIRLVRYADEYPPDTLTDALAGQLGIHLERIATPPTEPR